MRNLQAKCFRASICVQFEDESTQALSTIGEAVVGWDDTDLTYHDDSTDDDQETENLPESGEEAESEDDDEESVGNITLTVNLNAELLKEYRALPVSDVADVTIRLDFYDESDETIFSHEYVALDFPRLTMDMNGTRND